MKKVNTITSYDNLLSEVERLSFADTTQVGNNRAARFVKKIEKANKGYLTINLECTNYYDKIKEELSHQNKLTGRNVKMIMFLRMLLTSKEVILYRILLSNYILNEVNGKAKITLDEIHKMYRNKSFKYANDKYDEETLQAYTKAFEGLCNKTIDISFGESKIKSLYKYQ